MEEKEEGYHPLQGDISDGKSKETADENKTQ